jgi:DNA-binding beta-propeller fold protein YncE
MANDKDFVVNGPVVVGKDTKVTVGTITASAIDLSTGNYFDEALTADTTYTISNAGAVQAFQLEVTGGATSYDLAGASYDNVSFSVAAQETNPYALFFKPDGTKMYVLGSVGDDVNEYNLSTPWDVSTASFLQLFSVAAQDTAPTGISFKPDGTKMYILGAAGVGVNEYSLSIAWDISTASFLQLFSVAAQETAPYELFFKPDGTKMYVVGVVNDNVNEYDLSTPWDISTASFLQLFSVAVQETSPLGLFFKPDGTKMYVIGTSSDAVHQYSTSVDTTLTWPSSIEWAAGVAPAAPAAGETDVFTFTTDDGGTTYTGVKSIDNAS